MKPSDEKLSGVSETATGVFFMDANRLVPLSLAYLVVVEKIQLEVVSLCCGEVLKDQLRRVRLEYRLVQIHKRKLAERVNGKS